MYRTALFGMLAFATAAMTLPNSSPMLLPRGQALKPGSAASIANMKDKIKNVIFLSLENRSLDNLLGGQIHEGLENSISNGPFCNPLNVTDSSSGTFCTGPRDYDSVTNDPNHAVTGNTMEFYSQWTPDNTAITDGLLLPNNLGFITEQIHSYGSKTNITQLAVQVMNYYTEKQVPTLTAIVKNFLTFNHWHSDLAGVSTSSLFGSFPRE